MALLLAAGEGRRLGSGEPKAWLPLGGRPLLVHAAEAAAACPEVDAVVAVIPAGREDAARSLLRDVPKPAEVTPGGSSRQESVRRGLAAAPDGPDVVIAHDVARPLASSSLFSAVVAALEDVDGVVPVLPVADTVKRVAGGMVAATVDREGLALAQTPQAFRRTALERSHAAAVGGPPATDDAVLLERSGYRVAVVPGERTNLKVTEPEDVPVAEALLAERHPAGSGSGG